MASYIEKIKNLPPDVQSFFASESPVIELKKSFVLFGIDSKNSADIAKEVGLMYVRDLPIKDLPRIIQANLKSINSNIVYGIAYEINKRIFNKFPFQFEDTAALLQQWEGLKASPFISEEAAYQKVLDNESWILEIEKEKEEEVKSAKQSILATRMTLNFNQALKNYPQLGEQLLSSEKIKLQNFPEPVRPSIKNWLADYTFTAGHENRGSVQRGTYLFQNANTRRLALDERNKLSYILKAYDENSQITVNKNTKQVVFPAFAPAPKPAPVSSTSGEDRLPTQGVLQSTPAARPTLQPAPRPMSQPAPWSASVVPPRTAPPSPQPSPRAGEGAVFPPPQSSPQTRERTVFSSPSQKPADKNISFSYPQKLPYEKKELRPYRITPYGQDVDETPEKDSRVLGKNVVNLKDDGAI